MKKSLIRIIAFLSMMLMGTSLLFAQSEDGFQAEQAEAPVTEEHDIRDDPDYKYFAHDSNGNYVRDGAGNRVRVGRPITNPNQIQYVQHTRNLIEIEKDDIHLILDGDAGTFGLYTVAEKGNYVPLLCPRDSFISSYFTVKVGNKEYKLQSSSDIKTEARNTPLGAQMAYLISNEVQVVLDFTLMPSIATSSRTDMIRMTVFVINIGRTIQSFAVKGIFDTTLGENTPAHFSTALRRSINSEIQFQSMDEELWIRSSNKDAAIQFLFGGKEISKTEYVTLGCLDKIDSSSWVPAVQTSKSFNSVTSYNNSAIAVNWPSAYLDTFRTSSYGFYISVASGSNVPAGLQFLSDLENGKTALGSAAKNGAAKTSVAPKPTPLTKEEFDKVTPNILDNLPASSKEAFVKTREISEAQLDPDYIQDLIERINSLKDGVDENQDVEFRSLHEELDSILKRLGAGR